MNVFDRVYTFDYEVSHTSDIMYDHTIINNVPCPSILNPEKIYDLKNFKFQDGDIVVGSYQKAGSIILRVMIQLFLGLDPQKDYFHWLELDGLQVKSTAHVSGRRLLRTHLPFDWLPVTDKNVAFLFLYPYDETFPLSLYSHFLTSRAINFTGSWDDFVEHWREERVFYGSFYRHTWSWVNARDGHMFVWPLRKDTITLRTVDQVFKMIFGDKLGEGCTSPPVTYSQTDKHKPSGETDDGRCDAGQQVKHGDTVTPYHITPVAQVHDFLVQSNPSTIWRTEREKKLLAGGLDVVKHEFRKFFRDERFRNKVLFEEDN